MTYTVTSKTRFSCKCASVALTHIYLKFFNYTENVLTIDVKLNWNLHNQVWWQIPPSRDHEFICGHSKAFMTNLWNLTVDSISRFNTRLCVADLHSAGDSIWTKSYGQEATKIFSFCGNVTVLFFLTTFRYAHYAVSISQPPLPMYPPVGNYIISITKTIKTSCAGGRHNMPPPRRPLTFWPWKWCDVAYLCANFSFPRPLFSTWARCTRQTDVRH